MMGLRSILLLLAVLLFAFVTTAAPIPSEGGLTKKMLKQYKAKRSETPSRVARAALPSGYAARGATKRDATAAKPSQYYKH
ncbi:hypothetical protein B0H15DRAFT_263264 [Mycena belliarum]|uniref:Uncharacterized protein n=1 Tax=Mycena belliarum TaxID=1033014 RepID=A0AAD6UAB4_9AGAR|nr:hypothetical protein B0H15DRAFT_263264 [Mycena belliae]